MNKRRNIVGYGLFALAILNFQTKVHGEQLVDHGSTIPTTEEIIDYFDPSSFKVPTRTRGLQLHNQHEPAHRSRTISLQVNFAYNSDQLSKFAIEQLKPVGLALASETLSGLSFDLTGHTDAVGSERYNLDLSKRRANRVKQFFMERYGVRDQRISAVGRGEYELLNAKEPNSGVNRRVTVTANY